MGNYMKIIAFITISIYVAPRASGQYQTEADDSPVYWVHSSPSSKAARVYLESKNEVFSDELKIRTNVEEGRGRGGGPKGSKRPQKVGNPYGQSNPLPGSGYLTPPGFDTKRACANSYFTKNLIYSMITTLEYQKQMAMMLQTMVEGGQIPSGSSSSGGSLTGESPEGSNPESSSTTTTTSTTASTTTTTTTSTTTPSTTSVSTEPTSTLSPETVQELLNLLTDILQILPELLAQFAALEEHVYATNPQSADELPNSEPTYEVTDDKQDAIDRLSILERTLKDTDLPSYTEKLARSTDLVVKIIEQTMYDITVLAPTDTRVKYLLKEYENVARRNRWKKF